jgi:hypothetical protein
MVLQEELQKFLLMPPLHLVIILKCIRLIRRALGRSALSSEGSCNNGK